MRPSACLIAFVVVALCGCKSEEEKRAELAKREMEAAAKRMGEAAEKLGQSAAQLGSQGAAAGLEGAAEGLAAAAAGLQQAMGAAAGAAAQAAGGAAGKADLADFRALKALLPDKIGGLARKSASGEKSAAMGFGMSEAKGVYGGDKGGRLELKVMDGGMGVAFASFAWTKVEIDRETEDEYERTTTIVGRRAYEKYNSKSRKGELMVVVGGRYLVEVDGDDISGEMLKTAIMALDLNKLERLK